MLKQTSHYFRERFPVFPLAAFCILILLAIKSYFPKDITFNKTLVLTFIYLGFLLHMRILDEFKDYDYDIKHHPERPVQRGVIKLDFLKKLGIANLILLTLSALSISTFQVFLLFLFVILYSGLMFKEFFIKKFYEKSPSFYLITHQVVFIPLYLFFYSVFNGSIWTITNVSQLAHFSYLLVPGILIEIGRKIKHRTDASGENTTDTYAYVWGQEKTIRAFGTLILLAGLLSTPINNFQDYFSYLLFMIGAFILMGSYRFTNLIAEHSMRITSVVALGLPMLLLF